MAGKSNRIVVVVGLSLLALGVANTIAGNSKMNEYRARKQAAIAAGGESVKLPFSGTPSILDPSTDAQLLYESAAIKYEYYRTVRRGGHYFLGIGAALLLVAAIRSRLTQRRRARAQPVAT
ncbi:MAG: hypothetical protein ABR538_10950 [Candidatus Binatia bacterium]